MNNENRSNTSIEIRLRKAGRIGFFTNKYHAIAAENALHKNIAI